MPQIFQVLRCYKCEVFQVHQMKKDTKWVCKLCGEKQSVKRHYGLGTAKDCRIHVQKLNKMRGDKEEMSKNKFDSEDSEGYDDLVNDKSSNDDEKIVTPQNVRKESRWSVYVDKAEETNETNLPGYLDDEVVLLEIPKKRKAKRKYQQTKYSDNMNDGCELNRSGHFGNEYNSNSILVTNVVNSSLKSINPEAQEVFESNVPVKSQIDSDVTHQHERLQAAPQSLNKGSKWAQFIDNEDSEENVNSIETKSNKHLFELCDDSEIDKILDL